MLLIIDPQVDFISGSLPVPAAAEAMDGLAAYVHEHGADYDHIIVSADCHPMNHSSFAEQGGQWPVHCVADSVGAAVWPKLMEALMAHAGRVKILHKGMERLKEEYSIFCNADARAELEQLVEDEQIGTIDICGLAGDVCVARSLSDGAELFGASRFRLLPQYAPSLDGGEQLAALTSKLSIPCVR